MKLKMNIESNSKNVIYIKEMFGINSECYRKIVFPKDLNNIKDVNITYITGPSGSGKSLLGKYIKKKFNFVENDMKFNKKVPIIEALSGTFRENLYYLNMVGLSEAFLYLTTYEKLSDGQKFRFELAYMLSQDFDYILVDEFCSLLDRDSAKIVSYNLQKIMRKLNKHIVVITSHSDIRDYLSPDIIIEFDEYGNSKLESFKHYKVANLHQEFEIRNGNYNEFKLLERYHYFGDVSLNTLQRRDARYYSLYRDNKLMGILVTASPYPQDDNKLEEDLERINHNLRLVFRLILHPKVRGIGATKILYDSVVKNENYLILLRSALAKKYPFPKKLKMSQNYYNDMLSFQEYQRVLKISSSNSTRFKYSRYVLAKMMYRDFQRYNELIKFKIKSSLGIGFFFNIVKSVFPDIQDFKLLKEVIKPIEMEEYYFDNR
ncbi:hypothetical protein AB3331_04030 [Streptococcus sp. H49]|uniref:hypothetical protein n=1 Tax=Streptococcus huangxiaojuni TaxID=3237239 RepID=UPI0034A355B5